MNRTLTLTALALVCSASFGARAAGDNTIRLAAESTTTAAECRADASLGRVERQLLDKAAQGIRPLVQFIHRTRMIYQLDVLETVAWLDRQRACGRGAASLASNDG